MTCLPRVLMTNCRNYFPQIQLWTSMDDGFYSVFGELHHLPVADSCLFSLGQSRKFLLAESFLSSIALRNMTSVSFWRTIMEQNPSISFLADTWRRPFLVCTKGRACAEANTEIPGYTWALTLSLTDCVTLTDSGHLLAKVSLFEQV